MISAILGIDPGRDKIGWAFVGAEGNLLCSGIVPSEERFLFFSALSSPDEKAFAPWLLESRFPLSQAGGAPVKLRAIALGNGTSSGALAGELKRLSLPCPVVIVDERGTTLEARDLYWRLHRPLWRRWLPRVLWGLPRPVDDLAAWAIAQRGRKLLSSF